MNLSKPDQEDENNSRSSKTVVAASFSGPIPPPALLQQYDDVFPGAAERIVAMAEREAAHRHNLEERIVQAQINEGSKHFSEARCGQICALTITLASLGVGAYTALHGYELAGSVLGVGGIGGIVTTFLLGRKPQEVSEPDSPVSGTPPTNKKKRPRNNRT